MIQGTFTLIPFARSQVIFLEFTQGSIFHAYNEVFYIASNNEPPYLDTIKRAKAKLFKRNINTN